MKPQDPPKPAEGDIWAEIIDQEPPGSPLVAYAQTRRAFGIEKYGTPLQRDNGRDFDRDMLDEALDLLAYAHGAGNTSVAEKAREILDEILPKNAVEKDGVLYASRDIRAGEPILQVPNLWPEWKKDVDGDWCLSVDEDGRAEVRRGGYLIVFEDGGVYSTSPSWGRKDFPDLITAQLWVQENYPGDRPC